MVRDRARNRLSGRWSSYYAPNGHFEGLEEPLRSRSEEVFQSFQGWWGHTAGGQQGVNYWVERLLDIQSIVQQVETELNRSCKTLSLTVDYVYTGLGRISEVDLSYSIMSIHRPNVTVQNREWWSAKVRELA